MLTPERILALEIHHSCANEAASKEVLELLADWRQMKAEIEQARAALEQIKERAKDESKSQDRRLYHIERMAERALQSMQEPSGAERVRELWKKYSKLGRDKSGKGEKIPEEIYFYAKADAIKSTINLLGITIPGINAPETKTWLHHCPETDDNLGPQVVEKGKRCPFCEKGEMN